GLYMSPEQWGADSVDERTDLWAAGLILYELVAGEHPLAPVTVESLRSVAWLDVPMPSARAQSPQIGRLGALIDRCLVKHKADRLASARELCSELSAIARPHVQARRADGDESNPYTGLAAFQEHDARRFFGRERWAQQVVARLAEQPLLAIVGASGAG